MNSLIKCDPEIFELIQREKEREEKSLVLIASENYVSEAVLEAQGSLLTNKYAEGYPGARYYGGCEIMDLVEELARKRLLKLFHADYANVQPHSGSQANMAIYFAFLNPGDLILGMNLSHGGHLSHGSPVNFSGKFFTSLSYGVNADTGLIDYDQVRELAKRHRPRIIVTGASAYPRIIDFDAFKSIAEECGAYLLADIAHIAGLVVAGLHPSPVGKADFVSSTTHKTMRGPRGGFILAKKEYGEKLDKAIFPGIQGGPLMHVIAAKAVAFKEALTQDFVEYQKQVVKNAKVLAEELQEKGFRLVTGGTDNHLLLVDLTPQAITGKEAEDLLSKAGIVVNKNAIPYDKRSPKVTSGIRIGTPAATTRGLKEEEMRQIASWIYQILTNRTQEDLLSKIKSQVEELMGRYPLNLEKGSS